MTILPQYQGDYYTLQNKQALAQALMSQALQPQQIQATGSGPYTVMPKYSIGAGIAQLGQALLAAKMQQQASQGLSGLGQAQWASLAGAPQQAQQQPQASSDVGGSADGTQQSGTVPNPFQGGASNPQALAGALGASGGAAPQQPPQQAPQQAQPQGGGMLAPGSALNPSGMDQGKAAYLYMTMGPTEYAKNFVAPYVKPTDATLMARAGGTDVGQANRDALLKANNLPFNSYAPNTILQDPRTGQMSATPSAAPDGSYTVLTPNGPKVVQTPGALDAMQNAAAAKAAGEGSQLPYSGVNKAGDPLPVTNRTAAATQGNGAAPTLSGIFAQQESSGGKTAPDNPMQIQQGTFKQYAQPGESWSNPADRTTVANRVLNTYQQKYGGDLGRIATAYFSGEGNVAPAGSPTPFIKNVSDSNGKSVASYVGDIYSRGAGMSQGGGQIYAAAPMGAQAAAEAKANGQYDTMQKSYQNLQTVRSGAPAALQDVDNMSKLAQGASMATIGPAGAKFAGLFSANAAEYEKSRDNLVTNLGSQLGINSDAARDLVYGSIPSYGAPKQAVQNGLQTLRGQIQTRLLKSDYLSDAYSAGDAKAYNQRENQFDQNVTPAIANVVSMPAGPDRAAALKQAAANPQMRARLEWAAQNGVLK
jgi:hypothetical protein